MNNRTDILIIGAGPAGLSAAINAVARGKTVQLLSVDNTYLSRAEYVDNYLGLYHLTGTEMMKRFEDHAASMGITIKKGRVANVLSMGDYFLVNFNGNIIETNTVILATGVAKAKEIPGETVLLGRGVSYCATCDGMLYRGKKVIVWGLSPDSAQEANFLQGIGVTVSFVARGERPESLNTDISFISGTIQEIIGEQQVTTATISSTAGEKQTIETDGVFILRSAIAPSALISGLAIENGFITVNRKMETNIPGLFAAGDCTGTPLQVANAVGDGLIAAQQAAKYIDTTLSK